MDSKFEIDVRGQWIYSCGAKCDLTEARSEIRIIWFKQLQGARPTIVTSLLMYDWHADLEADHCVISAKISNVIGHCVCVNTETIACNGPLDL